MKKHERLPFEVIVSATEGDPEAIASDELLRRVYLKTLFAKAL